MTQKKKVFNSILNYDHTKQQATVFTNPSLTVPDHALTIPEMLKRFATGRPVNVPVFDEYSGDDDSLTGVDLRTLDISEIHDLMDASVSNLRKLKAESDARRKKQQDEELEASIIKKYEERKKQESATPEDKPRFIQADIFPGKKSDERP